MRATSTKTHLQTRLRTTKGASIKKSKRGTKQGHSESPLYSLFTIICAIIRVFSYLFTLRPPATRNVVRALIRYKCVLGRALLEDSPYRLIT